MADETILVVDADQEIDQRINSTLEAEGYLVFSGVSHVVTDEMAEKFKPSLIYIKPLSATAAGFEPCRTIHTIPKLQNVPIVLLASLKGKIEPKHVEYYGIVDFLSLNFTSEELIEKTASVLASAKPSAEPELDVSLPVEKEAGFREPPEAEEPMGLDNPPPEEDLLVRNEQPAGEEPLSIDRSSAEQDLLVRNEQPAGEKPLSMNRPSAEQEAPRKTSPEPAKAQEEFPWEDDEPKPAVPRQPSARRTYRQSRAQRPSLLPWLIGLMILVLLGGGGFLAYQQFMPSQRPAVSEPEHVAAAPEQKGTDSVPSAPPGTPPAPAAPVPQPIAPAETPEPAPMARQVVPAAKIQSYSAQVGAFRTEEIAESLVRKMKEKGYEAFAQKGVTKDNAPVIRVLVGNFTDRKAAMKLAADIQQKENIRTTIFTN